MASLDIWLCFWFRSGLTIGLGWLHLALSLSLFLTCLAFCLGFLLGFDFGFPWLLAWLKYFALTYGFWLTAWFWSSLSSSFWLGLASLLA